MTADRITGIPDSVEMNYRAVRDFLNTLTDQQLDMAAVIVGVEMPGGIITQVEILEEDCVYDEEGCCPLSVFKETFPDEEVPPIVWHKGDPHIVFERNLYPTGG